MAYASQQDLIDRFGEKELVQLTDRTNKPQTTIDTVVVDRALGDASAFADGYLATRIALPLVTVPTLLVGMVCDIARFRLHGKAAEKDGPVDRANTAAVKWLADVAKGLVVLEIGGAPATPVGGEGGVRMSAPTREFTRDSLRSL